MRHLRDAAVLAGLIAGRGRPGHPPATGDAARAPGRPGDRRRRRGGDRRPVPARHRGDRLRRPAQPDRLAARLADRRRNRPRLPRRGTDRHSRRGRRGARVRGRARRRLREQSDATPRLARGRGGDRPALRAAGPGRGPKRRRADRLLPRRPPVPAARWEPNASTRSTPSAPRRGSHLPATGSGSPRNGACAPAASCGDTGPGGPPSSARAIWPAFASSTNPRRS